MTIDVDTHLQPERHALGNSPTYRWSADTTTVDMSMPLPPVRRAQIACTPQSLIVDLNRTAMIVIDMQNDFCAGTGWAATFGPDYLQARTPIAPLQKLLPALRAASVPIIWLNWGNRPDLLNLPPSQIHICKPDGSGLGFGDALPNGCGNVLQKDSWSAAVIDELQPHADDIHVDKTRISGFFDTPLDTILRNLGVRTLLFAGVNTDQCVLCTLTDASFLGYGCVLLSDCCATVSPSFCTAAAIWNVQRCLGFVSESHHVLDGLNEGGYCSHDADR
ncbi:MAG: isochorismatase [Nevskia sp.]|nr:isochorismatase [Nevskia sp.]